MPVISGRAVRTAYTAMGMTRSDFAEAAKVDPRALTNATGGRAPQPVSDAVVHRIAAVLGWTYDEVVNGPAESRVAS